VVFRLDQGGYFAQGPLEVTMDLRSVPIKEDGAHIRITPATFFDNAFVGITKNSQSTNVSGPLLSRDEFGNILRWHLSERLRTRLRTRITVDRISPCPRMCLVRYPRELSRKFG
jgi:hypothetical protein